MLIEIYTVGRHVASFEPVPGGRKRFLVVPGGSEVLETKVNGRSFRMLFVPTSDPIQMSGWSAANVIKSVTSGCSRFQLLKSRVRTTVRRGRKVDECGSTMDF